MSMGGLDQQWLRTNSAMTEVDCSVKYAQLAAEYRLPVTLFVSGNVLKSELSTFKTLAEMDNVEIGGHTYNAFQPSWLHLSFQSIYGSYYGPRFYQKRDIQKTLDLLNQHTQHPVRSWRTHGYRSDPTTLDLLPQFGINVISDVTDADAVIEPVNRQLVSLPINIPPDHEHLVHGFYYPEAIEQDRLLIQSVRNFGRLPITRRNVKRFAKELVKRVIRVRTPVQGFGYWMLEFKEWWEDVRKRIRLSIETQGFATLLIHPACWEVLDSMNSLNQVFQELSVFQCQFARDAADWEF